MSALPKLNFPAIRLRARRRGDGVEVWDSLRGIYLVLTPEEWVRQHLIAYLTAYCGVQPKRIVQEYAVALNGQPQRADVVVVGAGAAGLSAGLKAAQDGKNVIILEKMGVIGGARCQYHLRQILVFLDAMVMNKPEFMGGVIQNKVDPQTGEVIDQSTLDHLTGQLTAFGEFIQRVKI